MVANGRHERMQALLGALIALGRRSLSVLRTDVRKRSIDDIENDVKGRNKRSKGKKGNASLCKAIQGAALAVLAPSVICGLHCHNAQSALIAAAVCNSMGRYFSVSISMLVSAA